MTDPSRDERLAELARRRAAGEALDAAERAALESSPEHAELARELADVVAELDRAGEQERAELRREAAALDDRPGRTAARGTLERLAAEAPLDADPPRPWTLYLWTGLAAAAVLALVLWLREPAPEGAPIAGGEGPDAMDPGVPDGVLVGAEDFADVAPEGAVEAWGTFRWRWRGALPAGGWYELRVWAADAPPGAPPLAEELDLEAPTWTPSPEVTAGWPAAIRWEVRVWSATRMEASATFDARRGG